MSQNGMGMESIGELFCLDFIDSVHLEYDLLVHDVIHCPFTGDLRSVSADRRTVPSSHGAKHPFKLIWAAPEESKDPQLVNLVLCFLFGSQRPKAIRLGSGRRRTADRSSGAPDGDWKTIDLGGVVDHQRSTANKSHRNHESHAKM